MPKHSVQKLMLALGFAVFASNALAQIPNPYGAPISLENAKKVAAAAIAEVRKNNWTMAAAVFKRPTKAWQDVLAGGGEGLRVLGLEGAVPVEGGLPLLMDGKVVGAIGVSGGSSAQDGQAAKPGADALK